MGYPVLGSGKWVWTRKELAAAAATNAALWDPASSKKVALFSVTVSTDTATRVIVSEGNSASGTRLLDVYLPDDGTATLVFPFDAPHVAAVDAVIRVTTSSGNTTATAYGLEVD